MLGLFRSPTGKLCFKLPEVEKFAGYENPDASQDNRLSRIFT